MQPDAKEKPSVLLVDDHPHNLIALEAVLGTSDYNILTASSGKEALALLEERDVALILLDIQMPEMDGYECARRVKACARTKHIPIILVTAIYREEPYIQKGYEAGAVDYFSKPFNPELLRMKVGIYADLYRKNLVLQREHEARLAAEVKLKTLSQTLEIHRRETRKEAERRAAELNTILESVPDAIYVGDEQGITRCNGAALAMFGFETCDELNQHFEKLADRIEMRYVETNERIPAFDQPFSHALRGEQHVTQVKIRHLGSGQDHVIACAAAPVLLDGQIFGAVVVNMDIPRAGFDSTRRSAS